MAYNQKTQDTDVDVHEFIEGLTLTEKKKAQTYELLALFEETSGYKAKMWGPSIIGFGKYAYTYESGHSGTAPLVGFSPRKQNFSLYFATGDAEREVLLEKLGKHKAGKACVYITNVEKVDLSVMRELILQSISFLGKHHTIIG